jgi:hypothetical protein
MRQIFYDNQFRNCQGNVGKTIFGIALFILSLIGLPNCAYANDDSISLPADHLFQSDVVPSQPPQTDSQSSNGGLLTRLIARKKVREYPPIPQPNPNKLVPPAGEEVFFPVRKDSQPFVLNVDSTVNLTRALNDFYYDPKWRGEVWVPFDQVDLIERATRMMSLWPEYDSQNIYHVMTGVSKFFEKYSGFGP